VKLDKMGMRGFKKRSLLQKGFFGVRREDGVIPPLSKGGFF